MQKTNAGNSKDDSRMPNEITRVNAGKRQWFAGKSRVCPHHLPARLIIERVQSTGDHLITKTIYLRPDRLFRMTVAAPVRRKTRPVPL